MNLLDENIRQDQEDILRKWRVKFRRISREFARPGIQDPEIIPLLLRLSHPTLFTHDQDFSKPALVHRAYCLVWLDLYDGEAALFIRRFLRHPAFRTQAQRLGKVVRVQHGGVDYWQAGETGRVSARWVE
jgi:hypothetical protein